MKTFFPSDPNDKLRTQAELKDWEKEKLEKERNRKKETVRFWITTILSGIAALAAVAGVIIQLVSKQ